MKKRLFSLLLAAALMLSLIPAVAMATETTPQFVSQNMTLENIPLVNFYVACSENPETAGYTMEVAIGGNAYTEAVSPEEYTEGTWVYKVPVKAKQLLKTVEVKLVKDGEAVDEGTFQLETYYDKYSALENKDEKMVALLETLINYGKYAEYFNVAGTVDPAVEKIDNLDKNIAAAYAHSKSSDLAISTMLLLDEACVLRIAVPADQWVTGYSLKVNGEYVAPKVKTMDGYVVCDIAGILPQNWDSVYKIQVLDTSDDVICTMKASVMSYANRALSMTGEEYVKLQGLMKAMFQYYRAADECVGVEVKYAEGFVDNKYDWQGATGTQTSFIDLAANTENTEYAVAVDGSYVKISNGKLEIKNATMTGTGLMCTSAKKGFSVSSSIVSIEFDVAYSELASGNGLMFNILQEGGKAAIDIRLYADKITCYTTTSLNAAGTYQANETYRVKIVANTDTDKYNLYIDNELVLGNVAMRNAATSLNAIRLFSTAVAKASTATYDNLIISQLKAMPTDATGPVITEVKNDTFTVLSGWSAMSASGTENYIKKNDNNQLEIKDDANTRVSAVLSLSNLTGKVGFEFDVASTELSEDCAVYFTIFQGNTQAIDVQLYSNAVKCYDSDNKKTYNVNGEYLANETYRVKIVADVTAKSYSVYIDGRLIVENVPMRNSASITALNKIRLWTTNNALVSAVTYDNLMVYTIAE